MITRNDMKEGYNADLSIIVFNFELLVQDKLAENLLCTCRINSGVRKTHLESKAERLGLYITSPHCHVGNQIAATVTVLVC